MLADLGLVGAAARHPDAILHRRQPGPRDLDPAGDDLLGGVGAVLHDESIACVHAMSKIGTDVVDEDVGGVGVGVDHPMRHHREQHAVARPDARRRQRRSDRRLGARYPDRAPVHAQLRRGRASAGHEPEGDGEHDDDGAGHEAETTRTAPARFRRPGAVDRIGGGSRRRQLRSHLP